MMISLPVAFLIFLGVLLFMVLLFYVADRLAVKSAQKKSEYIISAIRADDEKYGIESRMPINGTIIDHICDTNRNRIIDISCANKSDNETLKKIRDIKDPVERVRARAEHREIYL